MQKKFDAGAFDAYQFFLRPLGTLTDTYFDAPKPSRRNAIQALFVMITIKTICKSIFDTYLLTNHNLKKSRACS